MGHSEAYRGQPTPDVLPPDVLRVLRELATAIGHHTLYSDDHPVLALVAQQLLRLLEIPLGGSKSLTITVRRGYLVVGAAATDPSDLLLSGLASRLNLHELHSVTFRRGIQPHELSELLDALSQNVGHGGRPLGLAPDDELSRWSHIGLLRSALASPDAGDQGRAGMRGGADAAPFFTELAGKDLLETESRRVAGSIEAQLGKKHADRSTAVQIFMLAEKLKDASGQKAELLFRKVSELVFLLRADTLAHLLKLGDEGNRTNRFLRDSSQWMEPEALIELLRTAAENRHDGTASEVLRLTSKLAGQTSAGDRPHGSPADSAVRTIVRQLIEQWELEDRRRERHIGGPPRRSWRPTSRQTGDPGVSAVPPDRTVKMCIELDLPNGRARRASARMVSAGEAATLLDVLEHAPEESNTASSLWHAISTPRALRQLLEAEQPDLDVLDRIVEHVGLEGVESLLDVLARSKRRAARQYLLEQLSGMGPEVGPRVAGLLNDPRWYVVRNMLRLLSSLSFWPENLDIARFLDHEDPRVRVEALRLAVGWRAHRERAICRALGDEDERVVSVGLEEACVSCPPAAEPVLARHLRRRELPEELRVQAIRALGTLESRGALKAIAGACVRRRWIFGRRLSSEASLVQAGLVQLARRWPGTRVAGRVLRLAARSGNPDLTTTAAGGRPAAEELSAKNQPPEDVE